MVALATAALLLIALHQPQQGGVGWSAVSQQSYD